MNISFDMDGILAKPPFGISPRIGGKIHHVNIQKNIGFYKKYGIIAAHQFRSPVKDAQSVVADLADEKFTLYVNTGRPYFLKALTKKWLITYNFSSYFHDLCIMPEVTLPWEWKEKIIKEKNILAHIDDDPITVNYLAQNTLAQIYFLVWPETKNVAIDTRVQKINNLIEFKEKVVAHLTHHSIEL